MDEKALAEYLHNNFCTYNHTDYCGWYYEKDNIWEQYAHKDWLEKAVRLSLTFNLQ